MTEQDRQSARSVAYSIKTFCEQAEGSAVIITLSHQGSDPESMEIESSDMLQIDRGGVKSPANCDDDRDVEAMAELIRSGGSALSWEDRLFPLHRPLSAWVSAGNVLRIESGRPDPSEGLHVLTAEIAQ